MLIHVIKKKNKNGKANTLQVQAQYQSFHTILCMLTEKSTTQLQLSSYSKLKKEATEHYELKYLVSFMRTDEIFQFQCHAIINIGARTASQCTLMHPLCDGTTIIIQSTNIFRGGKWRYFIWCFIWTNEPEKTGKGRKERWRSVGVGQLGGVTVQWCLWGWWANTVGGPHSSQPRWIRREAGRTEKSRESSEQ